MVEDVYLRNSLNHRNVADHTSGATFEVVGGLQTSVLDWSSISFLGIVTLNELVVCGLRDWLYLI